MVPIANTIGTKIIIPKIIEKQLSLQHERQPLYLNEDSQNKRTRVTGGARTSNNGIKIKMPRLRRITQNRLYVKYY